MIKKQHITIATAVLISVLHAGGDMETYTPLVGDNSSKQLNITKNKGFYLGLGVGRFVMENYYIAEQMSANTASFDGGYRFNKYLDLEARYTAGVRDVHYKGYNLGTPNRKVSSKFTNMALYLKPGYQLGNYRPYLLLGYGQSKLTNLAGRDRKESSFQYGVGMDIDMDIHTSLQIDYVMAYDDDNFDGRAMRDDITIDMVTFGINYHF